LYLFNIQMEFTNQTLTSLMIFVVIILTLNVIFSINSYFTLRNKTGPRGPRGSRGPRGPQGRPK